MIYYLLIASSEEDIQDPDLLETTNNVMDIIEEHFTHVENDCDVLLQIYGILNINAFEIPNAGEGSLQAIYATGCLPEHNCVPSCHRSFKEDLSITLRSAIPLEANDRISITYTDSLWPTLDRRSHLAYSKYFHCDCNR